jgi:tetrahedral aminopeptidase
VKDLIKELTEARGPSGDEEAIRAVVRREIERTGTLKKKGARLSTDPMGNLILLRPGTGGAAGGGGTGSGAAGGGGRRVMLAAHMDEIGVIATHVDEKGFIRFAPLGGVGTLGLLGARVRFSSGAVGVIGVERVEDRSRVPSMDKHYIDVGADGRGSCAVKVGDSACFVRTFDEMGTRWSSKAMDDRAGCAVLLQVLRELGPSPHDVSFVFTVQEEVGLRGATTSGYGVDPEIAVAVDVTDTGDTPECLPMAVRLGAGPAIKVKDGGMLAHAGVRDWLVRTAEEGGIPFQLEVLTYGSTDARAIQTSRAGVPAGCLSIPCRYVHSPSETIDQADALGAVRLLVRALSGPIPVD